MVRTGQRYAGGIRGIVVVSLGVLLSMAPAEQDRFTVKAPNGVAFSEFRGYDTWQDVAVSQTEEGIKAILGNPAMINAYQGRHSRQWQAFSRWLHDCQDRVVQEEGPCFPVFCGGAGQAEIGFVHREGFQERSPDTNGWGYAQFLYDASSDTFKPFGKDSSFAKNTCHQCHTAVTARDFIFTDYPRR
jgi:hypothetical protein